MICFFRRFVPQSSVRYSVHFHDCRQNFWNSPHFIRIFLNPTQVWAKNNPSGVRHPQIENHWRTPFVLVQSKGLDKYPRPSLCRIWWFNPGVEGFATIFQLYRVRTTTLSRKDASNIPKYRLASSTSPCALPMSGVIFQSLACGFQVSQVEALCAYTIRLPRLVAGVEWGFHFWKTDGEPAANFSHALLCRKPERGRWLVTRAMDLFDHGSVCQIIPLDKPSPVATGGLWWA